MYKWIHRNKAVSEIHTIRLSEEKNSLKLDKEKKRKHVNLEKKINKIKHKNIQASLDKDMVKMDKNMVSQTSMNVFRSIFLLLFF